MKAVLLVLSLNVFSYTSGVNISLSSGELCLGAVSTWTCTVNGGTLGWRNLGLNNFHGSVSSGLDPLGSPSPFSTTATCIYGGIITSMATANLTIDVNRTTLDCSDGSFVLNGTDIASYDLILKDSAPAIFIDAKPSTSLRNTIYVTWLKAECASMYQLNITSGSMEQINTTASTGFPFPVPAPGRYMFSLSSIDYLGRSVGDPVSTEVCFTLHNFNVRTVVNYTTNALTIIIQDEDAADCQLPILFCEITVTDGSSYNANQSCSQGKVFDFTGVINETTYTFEVNITNIVGSSNETGEVIIEPAVTMITISPTTITETVMPSVEPCPPTLFIIIAVVCAIMFLSALLYFVFELCWRTRCCGSLKCWDSGIWKYIFFDSSYGKGDENKKGTTSLDSPVQILHSLDDKQTKM